MLGQDLCELSQIVANNITGLVGRLRNTTLNYDQLMLKRCRNKRA